MLLLGLTGSIAMGKSRAASLFRACGVPVFDADAVVHALLARGGAAVAPVTAAFPGCTTDGAIDRAALGRRVFADPSALRRLEGILHPLVRTAEGRFLAAACRADQKLVVLDIPLLLETRGERRVDRVAVVSASAVLQAQRALARPGMTQARLAAIRAAQMPDAVKARRADFLIRSGLDGGALAWQVRQVIVAMRRLPPRVWPTIWLQQQRRLLG